MNQIDMDIIWAMLQVCTPQKCTYEAVHAVFLGHMSRSWQVPNDKNLAGNGQGTYP